MNNITVGVGYTEADSNEIYNGHTFLTFPLNKIAINAKFLTFLLFLNGENTTFKVKYNY